MVRGLPAMAPAQDPVFSRVIRTISINGTRNMKRKVQLLESTTFDTQLILTE